MSERNFNAFNKMSHGRSVLMSRDVKERVMIDAYHQFPIPVKQVQSYPCNFTWKELISTQGILENDSIENIDYKTETIKPGFGSMGDEEDRIVQIPMIIVKRHRMETDEEYMDRVRKDTVHRENEDKKEYDIYLRLKAKFEKKEKK